MKTGKKKKKKERERIIEIRPNKNKKAIESNITYVAVEASIEVDYLIQIVSENFLF